VGATVHQPFDDALNSLARAVDGTFRIALAERRPGARALALKEQ
jgi:hypothetical protein